MWIKMLLSFRRIVTYQFTKSGSWILPKRHCSNSLTSVSEYVGKGNLVFSEEQRRQFNEVGRIEKVAVTVCGPPEETVLMINQNISTPYDCCKHISLPLCHQSPLALLNDTILWDMHRPLPGECTLKFLTFRDKEPFSLNEVFWRTGSFILGAVIMKAFKKEADVVLWNFPEVNLNSGSFIYDVMMKVKNWVPTVNELKVLSGEFMSFVLQNHKIERLDVKKSVAFEIFEGNPSKQYDLKKMAANSEDHLVTLYRVGDHIDVSTGPMVGDTSFFGRASVASVHSIGECEGVPLYRFQGVALPKGILLNSFAYQVLLQRAQNLNEIRIPLLPDEMQPYGVIDILERNSKTSVPKNFFDYNF